MASRTRTMPLARRAVPMARTVKAIASVSRRSGEAKGRRKAERGTTSRRFAAFLAGSGAGAAAEYLLDPADGKRRRHMLRDRTMATLRRGTRETGKKGRYMAGKAHGVVAEATPPGRDSSELNDPSLKAKVETELFRPAGSPKGSVDVSVENGVVLLRGEAQSSDQADELMKRAEAIDGVSKVESRLQVADAPASKD